MKTFSEIARILVVFLMMFSCNQITKESYYYPNEFEFSKNKNSPDLSFNEFKDFNKLIDSLEILNDYGKKAVFKLKRNKKEYNFIVSTFFGSDSGPIKIKFKNILRLSSDSIYKIHGNNYPIDSLDYMLKKDLLNFRQNERFSDSPKKLIVSITTDLDKVENLLFKVFDSYNKIKLESSDSIQLNIHFNKLITIVPTPPKVYLKNDSI